MPIFTVFLSWSWKLSKAPPCRAWCPHVPCSVFHLSSPSNEFKEVLNLNFPWHSLFPCMIIMKFSEFLVLHSFCCCSVAQSCPNLCNPMDCSMPASVSLTISQSLPKFMSIALVMPSGHLILWCPLLLLPSIFLSTFFQHWKMTFPMSQLFASDDQNTGVSASSLVLPVSIRGCFPFRLTGLISLLSKGPSGVFSSTTVQMHQFFSAPPSLWSSSHNRMWQKTIALTLRIVVGRVMSLLFNTLFRFVIAFCQEANIIWFHGCSHHLQWF